MVRCFDLLFRQDKQVSLTDRHVSCEFGRIGPQRHLALFRWRVPGPSFSSNFLTTVSVAPLLSGLARCLSDPYTYKRNERRKVKARSLGSRLKEEK